MAAIQNKLSLDASPKKTHDTFVNFATKTGIGANNLSDANSYGFNPISRVRTLIEWMYRGSWLCGVGVDCVADDMTREGIELTGDIDPKDHEKITSVMRRMQIWQSINQVSKWARLYGGALGLICIDGQKYDTPLKIDTIAKGQFKGIVAMDRWMVTPDLNTVIKKPGPNFGEPRYYTIDASSANFPIQRLRVHSSRVFRMEGIELPYWQKVSENMWGISVLERLFDRLTAFDSATQGAAQLVYKSYLRTLKIKSLRELIAAGGPAFEAVTKNIEMIRAFQMNEGMTLLDGDDEFETHQYGFAGLSDVINSMGDQISGALQIPLTRLFGQAPAGLNATGENDMRTYYDNILRLQERWLRRPMDLIVQLCAINADIELPEGWAYEFKSLWQLTDVQKAEINASDVNSIVNAQSTGLLPAAAFLKELRSSGKNTGMWTSIDDQMIKDAETLDTVPTGEDLLDPNKPNPFSAAGQEQEGANKEASKPALPKTGGLPQPKMPKDPSDKIEKTAKDTADEVLDPYAEALGELGGEIPQPKVI